MLAGMNLLIPQRILNIVKAIIAAQKTCVKPYLSPILLARILKAANVKEYISFVH